MQVQLYTTKSFNWLDFQVKPLFSSYGMSLHTLTAVVGDPESSE